MVTSYGKLARANMMSAMVSALPLLRFAHKAMPTCENSRSTGARGAAAGVIP